jgi:hypothetical protein
MDKEAFKKYISERIKLDKTYITPEINADDLNKEYKNHLETKKKLNAKSRENYKKRITTDDEFIEKRKNYNKNTYEKLKRGDYAPKPARNEIAIETEPIEINEIQQSNIINREIEKELNMDVEKINLNLDNNKKVYRSLFDMYRL